MVRGGIVEGRIVDSDGEPMAEVEVMLERFMTIEGKRNLRPMGGGSTDDRGQFRLFGIEAGKYYVSAQYRDWNSEAEEDSTYPPIYFPGTANAHEATRIDVVSGGQVSGIDITLSETKAFSISGKVLSSDGKPALHTTLTKMRMDAAEWRDWDSRDEGTDAEGNFKLGGLLPGRYRLTAETRRGDKIQMASIMVDVGSEDIRSVVLSLGEGAEVSGNVIVEGGNAKLLPPTMRLFLQPEGGSFMGWSMRGGEVLEDQTFAFRDVSEGAYFFTTFPQLPNLYLKSVRVQGKEALDQPFEVRNGEKVTGAELVFSTEGGEVSGVVKQDQDGEIVKGATVLVFSTDAARQGPRSRWTRTTQSDQQGRYQLSALAPGEYLICALQNHQAGAESSTEYLQELAKNAKTLSVQPRGHLEESLAVQPVPSLE
jgi:hypothetical protein